MSVKVVVLFGVLLTNTMRSAYCSMQKCNLSTELLSEIQSYAKIVNLIERTVVYENGTFKNLTWTKLVNFVDDFGSRLSGTENLEDAIDFLLDEFKNFEFDNVHTENVSVPHWVRNIEFAVLQKPTGSMNLTLIGLGGSIGTPSTGINASVMVVRSFEELQERSSEVPGKIVVFNQDFVGYHLSVKYRWKAAIEASKLGAVAVLVRSIIPFSRGSARAGALSYDENVKPIPAASISVQNAEMLNRLHRRGVPLQIHLFMGAQNLSPKTSRNLVGEIQGGLHPGKVVILSGHIDSWDIGRGAMDDADGAFISWMSLAVMRRLNLRPKRTVRAVLWTAEERGLIGARSYLNDHKSELRNITLMMESYEGTLSPSGFIFFGPSKATCIMEEVLKLMAPFNATLLKKMKMPVESDISVFQKYGISGAGLLANNESHFWHHRIDSESMTVVKSSDLDKCLALFAATAYVVADLEPDLPGKMINLDKYN